MSPARVILTDMLFGAFLRTVSTIKYIPFIYTVTC